MRGLPHEHRIGPVSAQSAGGTNVLVALGANCPGPWGTPRETLARALSELEQAGLVIRALSGLYQTAAIGQPRQPPYVNAVARIATSLPAPALLRLLKETERRAGRRGGRPWGARTLDLDLIDYKGLVRNWRGGNRGFARAGLRPLILPHPLMHERPFVLKPLLDVAPRWRHPVLHKSGRELWRRVASKGEGRVLKRL
jgi:2-amino-4-hydroxy-6-hydroxymethyldihydropteridine diphosphokinase